MDTIERANKTARVTVVVLAVLASIAVFFSQRFFDWVGLWLVEDPGQTLVRFDILVVWMAVFSLPFLAGGIVTYRNGRRSVVSNRFPPVGMWVIADTPVETGSRAKFKGRLLQFGGAFMCVVAVGLPFVLWYTVHSFADIERSGGTVEAVRFNVPGVVVFGLCMDPAGNAIGLVEMDEYRVCIS